MFHFSAAVGLVHFLTCLTHRVEGWYKDEFLRGRGQLTIKEGSESMVLVATVQSPFVPQTKH